MLMVRFLKRGNFSSFRHIMEGMNLAEMKNFLILNGENLQLLQSIDWNTVQVSYLNFFYL